MSVASPTSSFLFRFSHASVGPIGAPVLRDFTWCVRPGESWVITGPNSSGKSAVAQALAGGLPVAQTGDDCSNALPAPDSVSLVSFERQREIFFDERYHDDGEFMEGGVDPGTPALDFILGRARGAALPPEPARFRELVERLGISVVLDTGLKYLSTGEFRKLKHSAASAHADPWPEWMREDDVTESN
jgi:molybdate transport system ATP-binding protein